MGGVHSIVAVYGGDASFPTSRSSTLVQSVNQVDTTSGLVSSVNPSTEGQQVIFTATVSPAPDGGTVAFSDGGSPIAGCAAQAVNATTGVSTCAVTYLVAGVHSIGAVYGGDASYASSSAAGLSQTVNSGGPTYTSPGTYIYTVPPGVSQISFDVYAAQGGSPSNVNDGGSGGFGGEAKATIAVTAGNTYQ